MGFAVLSDASSCARSSFFSASGTVLSALSAAISFLICSGGSVNFFVCGSIPDIIINILNETSSYSSRLAKHEFAGLPFMAVAGRLVLQELCEQLRNLLRLLLLHPTAGTVHQMKVYH